MRRSVATSLALLLSINLSACAVYEALGGMPYAEDDIAFASKPDAARVIDCVRTSVVTLGKDSWWATNVTKLEPARGLLETGHYPESNLAGVRLRAVYDPQQAVLRLQIKAGGPYYVDLGAQKHLDQLRTSVSRCIDA
ncbi:MAG: hypothetical protein HY020_03380 [Burkholderiales bacterium]|nr:hypothetical protein [Burkholderiales bacterium]